MFSSITSVYGNARQGNYAAANAFLDAFAAYRRAQGLPAQTVNWGVFSDAGYVAERKEVADYLAREGQHGLPAEQGFAAMASLMGNGIAQATIARTDWERWAAANPVVGASPRFRALVRVSGRAGRQKEGGLTGVLSALLASDELRRGPEVSQHVRRRVARILGTGAERVETGVSLTDMGMDSLMAVELMTVLKNDLGIDLPAVKLLRGVTVDQLTESILEHLREHAAGSSSQGGADRRAEPARPAEAEAAVVAEARPAEARPAEARPAEVQRAEVRLAPRWTPFQRLARAVLTAIVDRAADVRIEGAQHIPPSGAVLIAANHASLWDAPILLKIADRRTVIFAAHELRRYPWLHWTLHKIWGAIYIKRGTGDTEAMEQALDVLRSGAMVGIAPEGRLSANGLRRGLTGAAHLALRSDVPVLPVAISGQERIRVDALRLRRARVQIRIGEPIPAPAGEPTAETLRAHTDRVMIEIARMLPAKYRGEYASAAAKS